MSDFKEESRYEEPLPPESIEEGIEISNSEIPEANALETNVPERDFTEADADIVPEGAPEENSAAKTTAYAFVLPPLVKTALMLFVITAISAFILAFANALTKDPIAVNLQAKVNIALRAVLPDRDEYTLTEAAAMGSANALYLSYTGGRLDGYAVQAAPSGYGGEITMIVGMDIDGLVTDISIIKMTETAGLGTKCKESDYLAQFVGKHTGVAIGNGDNEVDAISGATISSKAVTSGVADALATVAAYQVDGGAQ